MSNLYVINNKEEVATTTNIRVKSQIHGNGTDRRTSITILRAFIKLANDPVEHIVNIINPTSYTNWDKQGCEYNIMLPLESWLSGKCPLIGFTGYTNLNGNVLVHGDILYGSHVGLTAIVSNITIDRHKLIDTKA